MHAVLPHACMHHVQRHLHRGAGEVQQGQMHAHMMQQACLHDRQGQMHGAMGPHASTATGPHLKHSGCTCKTQWGRARCSSDACAVHPGACLTARLNRGAGASHSAWKCFTSTHVCRRVAARLTACMPYSCHAPAVQRGVAAHGVIGDGRITIRYTKFMTPTSCLQDDKGEHRGFGFVNFKDTESAAKCVEALTGKEHKGKTLFAGRAQKKTERDVGSLGVWGSGVRERDVRVFGVGLLGLGYHEGRGMAC
jgi:hypothetical protein